MWHRIGWRVVYDTLTEEYAATRAQIAEEAARQRRAGRDLARVPEAISEPEA